MTMIIIHYLDGTQEAYNTPEEWIEGHNEATDNGWQWPKWSTYQISYRGGGPGPGGGGVAILTRHEQGGQFQAKQRKTIPLMRVHHIEEREPTQEEYDAANSLPGTKWKIGVNPDD